MWVNWYDGRSNVGGLYQTLERYGAFITSSQLDVLVSSINIRNKTYSTPSWVNQLFQFSY